MIEENLLNVSAIICTRNRAGSLTRALRAMLELDLSDGPFELIIVDNGSSDDTKFVIEEFAGKSNFQIRYVFEPKPGLSYARNCGLRNASGDLILFTDDDCYVEKEWVGVARKLFADNLEKMIGGRVEQFNKSHLRLAIKTAISPEKLDSPNMIYGFLHGANMAFGRCVLARIGYFDVRFGAGTKLRAAEDTDFTYRALIAGIPVTYEPTLVVQHDHGRSGKHEQHKLEYGYTLGIGGMLAKNLLNGRTDLMRPIYWDVRSHLRGWNDNQVQWRELFSKIAYLNGAVRFLVQASWRKSS